MDDWKAELAESFWEIERSNNVLRTKKDRYDYLWFEIYPGWFVTAATRSDASSAYASEGPDYGASEAVLAMDYGPLTDVTDAGEPLDTKPGHPVGDCEECAQWVKDLLAEEQYTPRRPEPGDRVRVSYEATYARKPSGYEYTTNFDGSFGVSIPKDAEVTVIEPARPAVPEEPADDVYGVVVGARFFLNMRDKLSDRPSWLDTIGQTYVPWSDVVAFAGDDTDILRVERGAVID